MSFLSIKRKVGENIRVIGPKGEVIWMEPRLDIGGNPYIHFHGAANDFIVQKGDEFQFISPGSEPLKVVMRKTATTGTMRFLFDGPLTWKIERQEVINDGGQ